jgi:hypothetical protein
MEDLKAGLASLHEKLMELETAASKLDNKNFADIVRAASGSFTSTRIWRPCTST